MAQEGRVDAFGYLYHEGREVWEAWERGSGETLKRQIRGFNLEAGRGGCLFRLHELGLCQMRNPEASRRVELDIGFGGG